jgi:hypothetical protein
MIYWLKYHYHGRAGFMLKKFTLFCLVTAITGCSANPLNTGNFTPPVAKYARAFLDNETITGLEKEYSFKTKKLAESYLDRKLNKWLDTENNGLNVNELNLLKEITFAAYKGEDVIPFKELLTEFPQLYSRIITVGAVNNRIQSSPAFALFMAEANPFPVAPGPAEPPYSATVNTITLNWTEAEGATGYVIYRDNSQIADILSGSIITFSDAGLEPGTAYSYSIYSLKGNLRSTNPLVINAVTEEAVPLGPVTVANGDLYFRNIVTVARNGNIILTWAKSNGRNGPPSGVFLDVWAKVLNSSGQVIKDSFIVNEGDSFNLRPSVSADENGNFVIAWERQNVETSYDIMARKYSADGTPQENSITGDDKEFMVNTGTSGNQWNPAVSVRKTGDFVISWGDSGNQNISARQFDAAGVAADPFTVSTTSGAGQYTRTSIGMQDNGNFVVVWSYKNDTDKKIYGRKFDSSAVPLPLNGVTTEAILSSDTSNIKVGSEIAMSPTSGNFVVVWKKSIPDEALATDVFGRIFDSSGTPQTNGVNGDDQDFRISSTFFSLDSGFDGNPVAMDQTGNFIVTWAGKRNGIDGEQRIFIRKFNASGTPVNYGTTGSSDELPLPDGYKPAISMSLNGDYVHATTFFSTFTTQVTMYTSSDQMK